MLVSADDNGACYRDACASSTLHSRPPRTQRAKREPENEIICNLAVYRIILYFARVKRRRFSLNISAIRVITLVSFHFGLSERIFCFIGLAPSAARCLASAMLSAVRIFYDFINISTNCAPLRLLLRRSHRSRPFRAHFSADSFFCGP